MKKLMLAACALGAMIAPAAAKELPDFNDKAYTCETGAIEHGVKTLGDDMGKLINVHVMYVKESSEISRNSTELKCRITVVFSNTMKMIGEYGYLIQDGHALSSLKFDREE
jgi:hypothetical protein